MVEIEATFHLVALLFGLLAVYYSRKVFLMLGSRSRMWFIFNMIGIIILSTVHLIDYFGRVLEYQIFGLEITFILQHLLYISGIGFIAFSYWAFIKKFRPV